MKKPGFSDLMVKDVQCENCGGHAVIIFPRGKFEQAWPSICFFCGELGLMTTGPECLEIVPRSKDWVISMLDFVGYHTNDSLMWLPMEFEETHVV